MITRQKEARKLLWLHKLDLKRKFKKKNNEQKVPPEVKTGKGFLVSTKFLQKQLRSSRCRAFDSLFLNRKALKVVVILCCYTFC